MPGVGKAVILGLVGAMAFAGASAVAQEQDVHKQIDQIKSVLPKFAIPMREVGDRFQNMYFAAKGGNWALAAYMSKYMNGAMNPASVTKPNEYPIWKSFYESTFAATNKAIQAKDFKAFDSAYGNVTKACNGCHQSMGYGFIVVTKLSAPADPGMDYKKASEPGDVPP
jgi:hypothetical protein